MENKNISNDKMARVLRCDKDTLASFVQKLEEITGKKGVLDKIASENESIIKDKLFVLGAKEQNSGEIYHALLERIKSDDQQLFEVLNQPICLTSAGCQPIIDAVGKAANVGKGFFLKEEKAKEFLINTPPVNVVKALGYKDAKEMLDNEDLFEVFSSLRFMEDGKWLNETFFKQYEDLTPDDFEERELKMMVLSERWKDVAEKFLKKKWHNISHLKEMGVVFVLPAVLKVDGETLRTIGLLLHYNHEISFYSKLFRRYAQEGDFAAKMIGSLRGDVLDEQDEDISSGKKLLIVQRYLAKDDPNDWRLFVPHVDPEALHWKKAEDDISEIGNHVRGGIDLHFWKDLDWVGDFYPTETGIDVLVSFNLVDTVMSLVKKVEMIKYLYHHQEALWNKIFADFVGAEKMEDLIVQSFEKGFIDLADINK